LISVRSAGAVQIAVGKLLIVLYLQLNAGIRVQISDKLLNHKTNITRFCPLERIVLAPEPVYLGCAVCPPTQQLAVAASARPNTATSASSIVLFRLI
jgi:hypothetical protein